MTQGDDGEGEGQFPLRPHGVVSRATESGDRASALRAIRDRLASELDVAILGRDVAAISKELRAVLAELEKVGGAGEVSPLDEITAQRAKRRAAPTGT